MSHQDVTNQKSCSTIFSSFHAHNWVYITVSFYSAQAFKIQQFVLFSSVELRKAKERRKLKRTDPFIHFLQLQIPSHRWLILMTKGRCNLTLLYITQTLMGPLMANFKTKKIEFEDFPKSREQHAARTKIMHSKRLICYASLIVGSSSQLSSTRNWEKIINLSRISLLNITKNWSLAIDESGDG